MAVEPGLSPWVMPDASRVRAGQGLVALGADLSPATLLAGYRAGLFPMPDGDILGWWSPDPRGILHPDEVHVSRSLRSSARRFTVSIDRAFPQVVAACADPVRPHGWITAEYAAAYRALHALGWAHSVEVWDAGGALAGGLFGVEVGGLFAAESKFHVQTDASKVAVVALARLMASDGDEHRLIDVQWLTEHLARLGAVEVPRGRYLRLLADALTRPALVGRQPAPVPLPAAGSASLIRWRTT